MTFNYRPRFIGRLAIATTLAVATAGVAQAETIATVNGAEISSAVFDTYLEGRLQKTSAQATQAEKDLVLKELTDIYLLTTQPRADELMQDEQMKAQAELQYRGMLAQAVANDYMANNQASDDEILAEYAKQIEESPSEQYKARHILVETQSAAVDLISQLDDGADFQELARTNSTGPSAPSGGDLGWFSPEQMVKPFADATAALENGSYSKEPVQTQFGWHVILREDSRANEPPTLESVRQVIQQRLAALKLQTYIQGLREGDAASE